MKHEDFNFPQHGFAGHLAEPDEGSDRAVIVIMGGEQSLLPGIKFAERFADYGITGLAVSLFGAEGLPDSPDRIPLDMFLPAVRHLREKKQIEHISVYGQSMGSIFAVLAAQYIGGRGDLKRQEDDDGAQRGDMARRGYSFRQSRLFWSESG